MAISTVGFLFIWFSFFLTRNNRLKGARKIKWKWKLAETSFLSPNQQMVFFYFLPNSLINDVSSCHDLMAVFEKLFYCCLCRLVFLFNESLVTVKISQLIHFLVIRIILIRLSVVFRLVFEISCRHCRFSDPKSTSRTKNPSLY